MTVETVEKNEARFSNNVVIITAAHPNGETLRNAELNSQLENELENCVNFVRVHGKDENLEDVFFCYDLPLRKAKELAARFHQDDFIYGYDRDDKMVWIHYYQIEGDTYVMGKAAATDVQVTSDADECCYQVCRRIGFPNPQSQAERKRDEAEEKAERKRKEKSEHDCEWSVGILSDEELKRLKKRRTGGLSYFGRRWLRNALRGHDDALRNIKSEPLPGECGEFCRLSKSDTGLPCEIWFCRWESEWEKDEKIQYKVPRIKIRSDDELIPILCKPAGVMNRLYTPCNDNFPHKIPELELLNQWVGLNYELIFKYWDGTISDQELMNGLKRGEAMGR